ncbi:uncharacterized protein LOC114398760 [Glycine soja]|uniref:uncharacterized protein n=1 Tax=Glycine max TaxID=3847 RepID=UPI000719210B|nr:uncharacterized protein LOC106797373 [Glycine max]XP_028216715.1 uncharacterized protein LOC114398760 [Glycine soja]|eukprot:XP_014627137.1 uncharacterized protein LOC106797373 [Glycine max]
MELNTKAHYTLRCALSNNEYNKICRLKTTKEIWDSLNINYEGTKDVQLRKIVTLTRHYESFPMKEGEHVDDMFRRLQVLLNDLEALRHTFTKARINLKILDSFPKAFKHRFNPELKKNLIPFGMLFTQIIRNVGVNVFGIAPSAGAF